MESFSVRVLDMAGEMGLQGVSEREEEMGSNKQL
jgi:hypothetical protein